MNLELSKCAFDVFKAIEMYYKKINQKLNNNDLERILSNPFHYLNKTNCKVFLCRARRRLYSKNKEEIRTILKEVKRLFENSNQIERI